MLAGALVMAALIVASCTWATSTSTSSPTARAGRAVGTAARTSTSAAQAEASQAGTKAAKAVTSSSDASMTLVKATSAEVVEVRGRITDASIEPGSCATVAYTPDTASTTQVGDLCVPQERTHPTAIVLVHGGGGTGGSRVDLEAWQQKYADLGYVTFSIPYRLTDAEVDNGVWPEPEQDVKAAIQFIRLAGSTLGTDKVVVQGHSAGARLGGVILTTPDDAAFRGSELWSEPSDAADAFIGFYGYYTGFQFEGSAYYGQGAADPAEFDANANAADASGPALLITGSADSLVEASESEKFDAALTATGKDTTLISVEGLNHGFDLRDGQLTEEGADAMDQIQVWIAQHVERATVAR